MIDADLVAKNLAIGATPPEGVELAKKGVALLVLAAKEHQPPPSHFPNVLVIRAPFVDQFFDPLSKGTLKKLDKVADKIAETMKEGGMVLVTCYAGKNRSGLLAGLALRKLGVDGKDAVKAIQKNRPGALSNPRFRKLVES
jgi:protein-tyrosine phosphatase